MTEGSSLETQQASVKNYAMHRGYLLMRTFVEPGVSAKTDQRPVLKELLAYSRARRGRIGVVIFPKLDRFARYTRDYSNLRHDLAKIGIRLESVGEHFDDSPAGRFTENMLASVAQFDNEVRAERSHDGILQAIKQGRWCWVAPPGFRRTKYHDKWTVEPDPPAAKLMVEAFSRLASTGIRPTDVRLWLWDQGIELSRAAFYRTIRKTIYIGRIDSCGLSEPAAFPIVPLVSEEVFRAARANLRQKATPYHYERDHQDFPLRGTLLCRCGHMLTANWSRGRLRSYAHYRCTVCRGVNLPKALVERAFILLLTQIQPRPDQAEDISRRAVQRWRTASEVLKTKRQRLDEEIARRKELQQQIVMKVASGVIPDELARRNLDQIQQQIDQLCADRLSIQGPTNTAEAVMSFSLEFLATLGGRWDVADLTTKKRLQRYLFPSGLTYTHEGGFRTPPEGPFAGLMDYFAANLSQEAESLSETPETEASVQRDLTGCFIEWLQQLYAEFGEVSSQAGDPFRIAS